MQPSRYVVARLEGAGGIQPGTKMANEPKATTKANTQSPVQAGQSSQALMTAQQANELVFAVVGHVGSGTSAIASTLSALLKEAPAGGYDAPVLKARTVIDSWATANGKDLPGGDNQDLDVVTKYQDLGDEFRRTSNDNAAVARALIGEIRNPLRIDVTDRDVSMRQVLDDIMGLTKLNFNSCIYADGLPVTLRFADAIGEILTESTNISAPPFPFRHYI